MLSVTEDKYDQLIKILDESYQRIDSLLETKKFMKEMDRKFPESARPIPRMKNEREYVFNLCHFYHYQYRLVHIDIIESLAKIELLEVSEETIREWINEIILYPPFRYREDWDEEARQFMLEEAAGVYG